MQYGIKANEVGDLHISDVLPNRGDFENGPARRVCALRIDIAVQSSHFVTGADQHWRQHSTDVAKMASNKNSHCFSPRGSTHERSGGLPPRLDRPSLPN